MNKLVGKSVIPFGTLVVAMVFLVTTAIILMSGVTHAGNNQPETGRLITIHDRGVEKVIISEAATVGDAIKEAGITIDGKDAVEPAVTEKLVASEYQVNIYRARPVTIVDGNIRQKVVTPYQTAEQIAKDAGITLYVEDNTTIGRSDNVADGAGLELTIKRATSFTFDQYGKTSTVRTQAKTVGEMLSEKGIKLSAADKVIPSQDTTMTAGLAVRVWREGKQTVTVDEPVAFDIEKIEDADQSVGYRVISVAGVEGQRSVSYEISIENGQEVGRVEIASVATKQSVKQVEIIGIKTTTPAEARTLGHQMMLDFGYSEGQWQCLDNLWTRESQWTVTSGNRSSGAYGIPQSLPASKMSAYGSDYMTSAATQITWGLNYIKDRYSTPCGAWNHSESYNWY